MPYTTSEEARRAAYLMHAKYPDGAAVTAAARAKFLSRFESKEERSAHFRDMALRSGMARRVRALLDDGGGRHPG